MGPWSLLVYSDNNKGHIRRKRYRGTHPRNFSEKYKEPHPELYKADLERILARGATPAGSHRPIMVQEILHILSPKPGELAVDVTVGYGGHAKEILQAIQPGGLLVGFDRDQRELRRTTERFFASPSSERSFIPIHANFSRVSVELASRGIYGVDMVLADLGLSSMQIDDPLRGFSFKQKGPLDMRMDQNRSPSARDYLASVSEQELGTVLISNADEPLALEIAHGICSRRGTLETTRDLAEAICSVFPNLSFKDPEMTKKLRRTFQAIRIEVNGEFASLERFLADLRSYLKSGARVAILSFHSGEDRRVETAFIAGLEGGIYSSISTEALRPSHEERYANPRSSSAKLRWAIRA